LTFGEITFGNLTFGEVAFSNLTFMTFMIELCTVANLGVLFQL